MKRLLLLALLAFAIWYGWNHYRGLITHAPMHEAVIENHSGREMQRVRLTVGGQTFVRESVPDASSISFSFRVDQDASFQLEWQWANSDALQHWSGGMVPRGPMVQRHTFEVDSEGAVMYSAANKLAS